jgi:hypothetical protein
MGQMVSITHRPATVLERVEPGHWEGDLIVGSGNKSAIVTLVERTTRYTLLGHLPGRFHGAEPVRDAVVAALALLPAHLRRTLTWDQGSEMAIHWSWRGWSSRPRRLTQCESWTSLGVASVHLNTLYAALKQARDRDDRGRLAMACLAHSAATTGTEALIL